MSRYYAIECLNKNGFSGDVEIHGPFSSVVKAREFVIAETDPEDIHVSQNDLHHGRNEDWGSDFIIVQEVDTVRQVPVVTVTMELMKVKGGHPADKGEAE